jgi:hypothetical protein
VALQRAARLAPDWSGGTRIGEALGRFLDLHGGGLARGAVVLIVSDGWETGDPAELARQLARLRRRAHRIVWANPRTRHADYRPLVGGMAAAWPYCDAVVSAHRLDALDDLLAALRGEQAAGGSRDQGVPTARHGRPTSRSRATRISQRERRVLRWRRTRLSPRRPRRPVLAAIGPADRHREPAQQHQAELDGDQESGAHGAQCGQGHVRGASG